MKNIISIRLRLATLVAIVLFFCVTQSIVSSCGKISIKDNIDDQPQHIEVKYVGADSVLKITVDSSGSVQEVDTFTNREQTVFVNDFVYVPPTDSIIDAIYMSQIGVREATGHNDGKDVEKYLRSVGMTKGSAWCAAFIKWCFDQAHIKTTITAWSPTAHNPHNIIYFNGQDNKPINRGDVGTLYFPKLKRIGHTFFIKGRFGMNSLQTVEGNTNQAGSRDGDGVYLKIRPKSSIYSITRWF